jgi:hypothetical protein
MSVCGKVISISLQTSKMDVLVSSNILQKAIKAHVLNSVGSIESRITA